MNNSSDIEPSTPPTVSRRRALQLGAAGVVVAGGASAGLLAWKHDSPINRITAHSPEVLRAERVRATTGKLVTRQLIAQPTTIDLAGTTAKTSTYDGGVPTEVIRAAPGDQLRVDVHNQLPVPTTLHWHGLALRNDMDGVPGITMPTIAPGGSFRYQFTLPDPGTYWFHPHVGVQLDTGLMGALIIEDPHEPLSYDEEAVLVLDDWTDGVSKSPAAVLADLRTNGMASMSGMSTGMGGMQSEMGSMSTKGMGVSADHPLGKDTGDVKYPLHLINGKPPKDPAVITAKPGQRLRLRLINAASDTAYRFAIGGQQLTVIASDGFAVKPLDVDSLILGMGERYDVLVSVPAGAFPIISRPEGKPDQPAFAVLRAGSGATPKPEAIGLAGRVLSYDDLQPTHGATLAQHSVDRTLQVTLQMRHGGRQWLINGKTYSNHAPLDVKPGERVRLNLNNQTMMFHPMHLHGHTFALVQAGRPGVRKDTLNVLPMQRRTVELQADNPGQWLLHCHNAYHGELGMMTVLSYIR